MITPIDEQAVLPWEQKQSVEKVLPGAPGISIVIPIFNAGRFLERTLRSLLRNDLSGCEIILMDGGSTDKTGQIVEHYRGMFSHVTMERDEGQSDAINRGFQKATQPYLYWLNGDDIILPNALTKVRRELAMNPGIEVLVGDAYMTELDFSPINHFQFKPSSIRFESLIDYAKNHLVQPSVFFSRTAWDTVGPLDLSLHYAMDADLFIGMADKFEFHHFPEDIAYSVYHEDCKTRDKRAESISELAYVQSRHGGSEEARKTLDILVALFNDSQDAASSKSSSSEAKMEGACADCEFLKSKIHSLQTEYEKNKALQLRAVTEL